MSATVILGDSRAMPEFADGTVDLIVTSPPYWHIKDYGAPGQIGHGQTLHAYLCDLHRVWCECARTLRPGGRICVNIGDQFLRTRDFGRYRVLPLHAEIIRQILLCGLDYLGGIIWRKRTTMNTTGGAVVMGSFPHPPNGIVEIDYEHILIFRKPGPPRRVAPDVKRASALTRDEWKEYFRGHWTFAGARKRGHEAMFPPELPRRLIRMFSFAGDLVLDPFLGSGTTALAALDLGRRAAGYELNRDFLPLLQAKLGERETSDTYVSFVDRPGTPDPPVPDGYQPGIPDAAPPSPTRATAADTLVRVRDIRDDGTLLLADGRAVRLLGVDITNRDEALTYLRRRVRGKEVLVRMDAGCSDPDDASSGAGGGADAEIAAFVYLKNRIFINTQLLSAGSATISGEAHTRRGLFLRSAAAHGDDADR
jgi:modification methylase